MVITADYTLSLYTVVYVGLQRDRFIVEEEDGYVEVCAQIFSPNIDTPVDFMFLVQLITIDDTASEYHSKLCQLFLYDNVIFAHSSNKR